MVGTVVDEYRANMPDELPPPPPTPKWETARAPMTDIKDVGVICTVCDRSNDGLSDFCECRESLIGYRPLNQRSTAKWVESQHFERNAAGISTTAGEIETLRRWARRVDSNPMPQLKARRKTQGWMVAVLWVWLVASLVLTYFMTARQFTVGDAAAYVIVIVIPTVTVAAIGTVSYRRRNRA